MSDRTIEGQIALVTGANRGIGAAFVEALVARGAAKVYAGARRLESLEPLVAKLGDRVVPIELDVTDGEEIAAAAELAQDATILINNAGVASGMGHGLLDEAAVQTGREEFEVNVFGLVNVTRALAPALQRNGGGTIVNLGSVASLVSFAMAPLYSASKAAVHSVTQGLRVTLPDTLVVGVYPGPIDTDMAKEIPFEKTPAIDVANEVLDGIESGAEEVFPDPMSKEMGAAFLSDPKGLEHQNRQMAAEMAQG